MAKSKRLSIFVLTFFLLTVFAGSGLRQSSAASVPNDISGNWAYAQINYLIDQGIVSGYPDGTFKPNSSVTRAEFISMINRAFSFNTSAAILYKDVKVGDWFYNDLAKATVAGYISGYPDGTMKPNNPITREEAAVILAKVLDLDTASRGSVSFTDAKEISTWSINAIAALVRGNYISGYPDGAFKPANSITRAEAAAMIYNSTANRVAISGVSLDRTVAIVAEGESINLAATVAPSDATNQQVSWSSSDKNIAVVNSTGRVIGLAAGKATITVTTADGGYTDTCQVTVVAPVAVTGIGLDKNVLTLTAGNNSSLTAKVEPDEATEKSVSWSSSDPTIATVDSKGLVNALAIGTATITARTLDGGYKATCLVTVIAPVAASGVGLNKSSTIITLGYSEILEATVIPSEAANQNVTWSSSDQTIATVSSSGKVTAVAIGTAIITATTTDGGFTAACQVTVNKPIIVDGVSLNQATLALLVGQNALLTVSITPLSATNQNVDWLSSDNMVATVSNGRVTAVGVGSATITVRTQDGGKTATCKVTVIAAPY